MATRKINVTIHHNGRWKSENGKFTFHRKEPIQREVEINDYGGGDIHGSHVMRQLKKQHPDVAKDVEKLEYGKKVDQSIKEDWKRALGMGAVATGAGAATGALTGLGAVPGAVIAGAGYALFGDLKKDLAHRNPEKKKIKVTKRALGRTFAELAEGSIKDLATKDEEEKRLQKRGTPEKILSDKERELLSKLKRRKQEK